MTLNFERIGIPIAMIISKDDKQISKSNNHIVSINENSEETRTSYNDINLNKKECFKENKTFSVNNDLRFIYK